jgi:hypothetical protein
MENESVEENGASGQRVAEVPVELPSRIMMGTEKVLKAGETAVVEAAGLVAEAAHSLARIIDERAKDLSGQVRPIRPSSDESPPPEPAVTPAT